MKRALTGGARDTGTGSSRGVSAVPLSSAKQFQSQQGSTSVRRHTRRKTQALERTGNAVHDKKALCSTGAKMFSALCSAADLGRQAPQLPGAARAQGPANVQCEARGAALLSGPPGKQWAVP